MAKKLAHYELAKPPRASCNDHTHASASERAKPAALIQFLQEAVVDEVCRFGLTRFSSCGSFENLIDSLGPHVGNAVAGITHPINLIKLAERFGFTNFRVLGKRFHAEFFIRAQVVKPLTKAAEKAQ